MTLQEFTLTMLQTLTPYEEHLLRSRFGFSRLMASTVSVPQPEARVAREDVQLIEKRSLRKLRRAIVSHPRRYGTRQD